jgi:hypothetical protein
MPSTVIFGGGFAGLTAAHELVKDGHEVTLYEKLSDVGGMARSKRVGGNIPTEHSWRGIAPFYENFRQIIKEIPTSTGTVYNELTKLVSFMHMKDNEVDPLYNIKEHFTLNDQFVTVTKLFTVIMCGSHHYTKESIHDYFMPKLSPAGQDYLKAIGPWLGLDLYSASMLDLAKSIEVGLVSHTHTHIDNGNHWTHNSNELWHVMKKPTSEAVFEPWRKYLDELGVRIITNKKLTDVRVNKNTVEYCIVDDEKIVRADNYIVAINPFEFAKIVKKNGIPGLKKCESVVIDGPNEMISFQIAFRDKVKLVPDNLAFNFPDSEFNITICFQDYFFNDSVDLGKNVESLLTGTACICSDPGKLFGLPAKRCSKEQFIAEVRHQMGRCKQFQAFIGLHNDNRSFEDFEIETIEIWDEWKFGNPGDLVQNQSTKWVSSVTNNLHRPTQKTIYNNLFISGAHTQTSIGFWSMEGAVESGKLAAIAAGGKNVWLYDHKCPPVVKLRGLMILFVIVVLLVLLLYGSSSLLRYVVV